MAVKVFLTGATGYVGGTVHALLAKAHPDWTFTLLVRNEDRGKPVKQAYPDAKFVYGSLDDADLIEKAAAEADIVIHTADSSDHSIAANAIAKGLAAGHTAEKPGYWIHTSGTNILTWYDNQEKRLGEGPLPEQKYHDIDTIDRILNFPDEADHRDVDKIVLAANSDAVKVAILCPPTIYDEGLGTVKTISAQVPGMVRKTLEKGFAPIVGAGKTEWDHINITDLGDLFVKLADATQDPSLRENPEVFGPKAYYFAEAGAHLWADVAHWAAEEASKQGYLPEALVKWVTVQEVLNMDGTASLSWGQNSKGVAARARKYLGWEPAGRSLRDSLPPLVTNEAKKLGYTPKEKKG